QGVARAADEACVREPEAPVRLQVGVHLVRQLDETELEGRALHGDGHVTLGVLLHHFMCGRYTITSPAKVIAEVLGIDEPIDLAPRYNVCPGQDVPVVRVRRGEEKRSLDLLRWGLVPWFAKEPGPAARMINARAETAATSPAFRDALRERRCLVPADGFYEWQAQGGPRGPKHARWLPRPDGKPCA